ncbi:Cyclic nucleotide-binding domain-containing protein [Desulfocicer vacuolatum DSM 3385]|uniref:Cyclic nucleotide-binding domain-containing protein n=1 Tax=Desulfocicer vacuolatum DSM 3385 TaxID=1121400 RepID=A0A1W2E9E7_9BACT|nr:cyclic nucleotide-binding domain-containing protein [Desulfocicer vacuolatum]SMD06361.1 Cyclic nucleotide-binding domain-containing protein [Desulfocicer vacuolatum DSM 3385]
MSEKLEILKKSTVFSSLAPADFKVLESLMEKHTIQEGETLATAKERATRFFILSSGTLLIAMDEGNAVVVDRPGDFIGMELLSSKGKYINTVTALENGDVFAIKRDDFLDLIQEDSLPAETIMQHWNSFLEEKFPFVEQKETPDMAYHY